MSRDIRLLRIINLVRWRQVKSGGHAYNIGFSSTTGVQISLRRFDQVTVDARRGTATLGTGLTWDQVYGRLEPFGVMVAGGRIPGIGALWTGSMETEADALVLNRSDD